jgi:filamentous hemagglutinin family protein
MARLRNTLLATTALMPLGIVAAAANPLGSQVVGGSANVQGRGTSTVTVTQSTDKAIINWQTFNISKGETTQFVQPNSSSVTLNRVTGNLGASVLDGTLTANGRVFLVNPDGILFGANSKVNTGSFLATTNDIRNADFMAGRYQFNIPGRPDASIVNLGTITAQNGGFAALVAPGVRNTGTITARLGTVGLAAGNNFSLDFYGDRLITLGINDSIAAKVIDVATGQPLNALVQNDGKLKANGGRVELTAAATRQVVDSVINNTGVIEANSIGSKNGMIVLGAATAADKPAGTPTQTVKLSGTISAAGKKKDTKGGTIVVIGENIQLSSATIDASGQAGGGKVLIGGDVGGGKGNAAVAGKSNAAPEWFPIATASTVGVDAATTINASAKVNGDGGKVVVWSDQATTFYGKIKAQGGAQAGNGGFVETSGHQSLTFNGVVDTSAPRGKNGTLLLDPQDALITTNAGVGVVTVSSIQAALLNGDVVVTTGSTGTDQGNITVAANISWANANALTLSAFKDVIVNANISNTGGAAVNLRADNSGAGVGTVNFGSGATISTAGAVSIFYNPSVNPAGSVVNASSYVNPVENFAGNVTGGGTLTPYMLVNSVYDLQNVQNNLSGAYALGKNIEATPTTAWNSGAGFVPIGSGSLAFSGAFNGNGQTIRNLFINRPTSDYVGLFGFVRSNTSTAAITNVGLIGGSVTGSTYVGELVGNLTNGTISNSYAAGLVNGNQFVGGLIGNSSFGTVLQSYATGSVSSEGEFIGGLIGRSDHSFISQSHASGTVFGAQYVGGLVGFAEGNSAQSVVQSYATGEISGSNANSIGGQYVGGLIGWNGSNVSQSYATGSVTGGAGSGGTSIVGGLIGFNGGNVLQSYGTGAVTGGSGSGFHRVGGLVGQNVGAIDQAFATGLVSGAVNSQFGGLVSENNGGTVSHSYWDSSTTGQNGSGGGVALAANQLKAGLPAGFDPTVWGSNPAINNGYPHLLWQVATTPRPTSTTLLPATSLAPTPSPTPNPAPQPTPTPPSAQPPSNLFSLAPSNNPYFVNLSQQPGVQVANARINQALIDQVLGLLAKLPGIDTATEYAIVTLVANAVNDAVQKTLLSPTQTQALWAAFAGNLKAENTLGKGTGIAFVESVVTDALSHALEAEMRRAGYSEYLTQPMVFVVTLAVNSGFAALDPGNAKLGGPEVAAVYSAIQTTSGELVQVAQQGVGLWSDIQSLKTNFATLNANVDQLYTLAKQQQDLGNLAESSRLLKMASSTQTTINNLRKEYTVGGVSILESSGWNLLSVFAN